ncbi:fibronectin type III domain-containing protein [Thermovibrio ammonificans]|uniref:Fibronectin type III domain protein n=1 Tax=Thermovibrio ammonificans (strain DSM 15698 / JCM 12110 / HB-1) TaxID=648996 RepID=E8T3Y2_THEA1|nr:hypothetical protein [Thermovibrio ammonificans]ADU96192.1 hypothetical protein Theam_0219 [Thermovibrio ammonificans HB-1]
MRKLLILFPLLLSFTTCGHREAPKPPLTFKPATPELSGAIQEFRSPLIYWKPVKTFEDGRKISAPGKVSYIVIVNFGGRKVKLSETYFKDSPIKPKEKRCYQVVAEYKGHFSIPSEPVCIVGQKPIEAVPKVKEAKGEDGKAVVKFAEAPYPIEVFKNQSPPFIKPYRVINGTLFEDENVKNGETYTYRFRFSQGNLKGRLSPPVKVEPADTIPPAPPQHPFIVCGSGCTLIWEPSPSEDVKYYLVVAGGKKVKVNGLYFLAETCPEAFTLYAVDKAGNLSKPVKVEVGSEESCCCNGKQVGPTGDGELHKDAGGVRNSLRR